jgi:hypothetical protein
LCDFFFCICLSFFSLRSPNTRLQLFVCLLFVLSSSAFLPFIYLPSSIVGLFFSQTHTGGRALGPPRGGGVAAGGHAAPSHSDLPHGSQRGGRRQRGPLPPLSRRWGGVRHQARPNRLCPEPSRVRGRRRTSLAISTPTAIVTARASSDNGRSGSKGGCCFFFFFFFPALLSRKKVAAAASPDVCAAAVVVAAYSEGSLNPSMCPA